MGKPSRDKGARFECQLVNLLQSAGMAAERVPLSGAAGGSFAGDISVPFLGRDNRFEAKIRADGFKEIYRWLDKHKGLFLRADRRDALVVLRMADFCELVMTSEERRAKENIA